MSQRSEPRPSSRPPRHGRRRPGSRSPDSSTPKKSRPRLRNAGWKTWTAVGVVTLLGAASVAVFGGWSWSKRAHDGEGPGAFVRFEVAPDEAIDSVAERLEDQELVDRVALFTWYAELRGSERAIEPGPHWLKRGVSPEKLLQSLTRRLNRPTTKVVLPEGWDSFQIAERLASLGVCAREDFLDAAHDQSAALRSVGQSSFEGYLYPSTYDVHLNSSPSAVVERMATLARERFAVNWSQSTAETTHGLSHHELLILTSVVQKEAGDSAEIPTIASVFFNRLEDPNFKPRRMLQSDPTAGYGCKLPDAPPSCADYAGKITPALLRDPNNRYNTYRRPGLPPSPIGNPSSDALERVMAAPKTRFYFFVASGDGRHRFSESYAEHERAVGE